MASAISMKLELIVIPVADAERSKTFYSKLGWHCNIDHTAADTGIRIVQFTPPGSGSSVMLGQKISTAEARADLLERRIDVNELFHDDGGIIQGPDLRPGDPRFTHQLVKAALGLPA
jgi:catechol 2,3-dioxygenase-like lactoylglutathione lyase family enzyme